jgi:hypothetical protein
MPDDGEIKICNTRNESVFSLRRIVALRQGLKELLPAFAEKSGKAVGDQVSFELTDGDAYQGAYDS